MDGTIGTCTVLGDGRCEVFHGDIRRRRTTFTVTDLTDGSLVYDSASNTDPDGDSNGTVITVVRP
jgi:hypothetical protein